MDQYHLCVPIESERREVEIVLRDVKVDRTKVRMNLKINTTSKNRNLTHRTKSVDVLCLCYLTL